MTTPDLDQIDREKRDPYPRLKGRCPSCGHETLFRGENGYITCSWLKCRNPAAAHDLMVPDTTRENLKRAFYAGFASARSGSDDEAWERSEMRRQYDEEGSVKA